MAKTDGVRLVRLLLLRLLAIGLLLTSCDSFVVTTSSSRSTTPASTAVGPPPRQEGRLRDNNDECRRSRWRSSTSLILAAEDAGDAGGVLLRDVGVVEEWGEESTAAGAAADAVAVADLQSVTFANLTRDQGRKMIGAMECVCLVLVSR
jgi:hypothetical protein